ncbi:carotenoid oxygenase family protein [Massilia yuzhufengensis]|uniref:Carotenoid cleavage dioxygenase n=1 Tax=Massilia yuzhufengensis TaxID=1164594 RepID=A0A1I1IA30_9BURK|nr:carotenoid oxygenase family protein [Massilia yuzhufengensis]SFC30663.1 carotenoid cleavage dioxygenase [Massilia yuzhufengensis]
MDRRRFLEAGLGFGALSLAGAARADQETWRRFHAALARDPALAVYADTVGSQQGEASITGRLPPDLQGSFYRNGPGRFELGGERYHHWFDGDGFVQRWRIQDCRVRHQGRFVETRRFTDESAAGQFLYPSFGTYVARRGFRDNDSMNAANTNLLPFNGHVYALWEGGSAHEIDPETLATAGVKTWRDDLRAMPFSAHPKLDPQGGMWNFGALPGAGQLALYQIGSDGQVLRTALVPVPRQAMVHDFAVSAKHLVFLIPPYDLQAGEGKSFAERHAWAGSGPNARPLRVVVVSKDTLTVRRIFELPPQMVFHFGNAWEDGACTRFDVVLHEGDVLAELGSLMQGERRAGLQTRSSTVQVCLDYASGQARCSRLFGASEFPRVMPQVVGSRHRRLALLGTTGQGAHAVLDTVNLVDTDTGKADSHAFGAGWQVEEHVLVPRRGARSETDGYLVGVAHDLRAGVGVLTVFDAARIKAGPVALARLPYRTPHCFHGNFLSA